MDMTDNDRKSGMSNEGELSSDSNIFTDEESARLDFTGLFSDRFTNVRLLYSSPRGSTEIHTATRYGKRFALKGLKSEHRDDPILNMCMAKEFEIGISLDHPYIRRTIGLENVEGLGKRIILEYIDGLSLAEMLAAGSPTQQSAFETARQTAEALTYLHSRQIFHRDLKPENIMILHNGGNVKVIDFNLSDRDDYVILKNPAGSQKYMAPEQSKPDSLPSPEADYYSLGVVMRELAAASGDKRLRHAAALCMDPDPLSRRKGVDYILNDGITATPSSSVMGGILASRWLTYLFGAVCAILSAFIALHYLNLTINPL